MIRPRRLAALFGAAVVACAAALLSNTPASAASLRQISDFGPNPSNIKMYLYVPANVSARPAILVGVHWCHGTAQDFYSGTRYASLADQYGFIVIYPSASSSDGCWDVHSQASLAHNGGSDSLGIVSMVKYVESHYGGDANRVYATGHSSGGMMTNVLLGAYPDVFKAGAAFAGVPFGCFAGSNSWNSDCANGNITRTPQQWGDLVRNAYPGYTGPRPRMQLWHGTNDTTLRFHNFGEEIKQWTNVLGVSQTPTSTEYNVPRSTWTRTRYGSQVEAIQEQGEPHNLQILADEAVHFLGLDGTTPPTPSASPSSSGSASTSRWVGVQSGRCLDVTGASTTNGARAQLWDCNGQSNQNWTTTSARELRVYGNKCLDATGAATTAGTAIQIWDCNGQANQQWSLNTNGTITGVASGLCLDATGRGTTNGTAIQIWGCNGQPNQQWTRR